jgi:hypothetical protein
MISSSLFPAGAASAKLRYKEE